VKIAVTAFLLLEILCCLLALVVSIVPGVLNQFTFIMILVGMAMVPFVLVAGVGTALFFYRTRRRKLLWQVMPYAVIAMGLLFGTYVLLKFYVPRRIAFAMNRASFDRLLQDADHGAIADDAAAVHAGIYRVDEIASDPRGGTYFRVFSGTDGLSPDTMSYGFAYRPNAEGSPFGASQYKVRHLQDDWYWFRASDDWF